MASTPSLPSSMEDLMAHFNRKVSLLQEILATPRVPSASFLADLASIDVALQGMERQLQGIRMHLKAEKEALPKAKAFVDLLSQQEQRLRYISAHLPSQLHDLDRSLDQTGNMDEKEYNDNLSSKSTHNKEKKGRSPPRRYITSDELDSLSSYMRGRLTLDKINASVDEMASYAETNAHLLTAPRRKVGEDVVEKAMELRDVAAAEAVKGKYFCLESDLRGPVLKLDTTGKAILTVLRHLGRILDVRAGRHRVFVLLGS